MHLSLCEINLDSQGFRWFYLFAHSLAVFSILGAFVLGFKQKKKSLIWFRVSRVLDYGFRIFLIAIILLCLFGLWEFAFIAVWQSDGYWSNAHIVGYLISYLLTFVVGILIVWLVISIIWRISLVRIIARIESLIANIPYLPGRPRGSGLVIDKAIYGTLNNKVDVTDILNAMIGDNKLFVIASNSLAGDPEPGQPKTLTVTYRYHGKQLTRLAQEGYELKLPPDDHPA
jgi:hypothetical protein